jgi:hypothetical protein
VLMADGRPGFGATVDLVRSALVVRFRGGARALREPAWQEAAAAVQLFGAIMLLAVALRRVLMVVGPALFRPEIGIPPLATDAWVRSVIWLAVVVCAVLRLRAPGLVLATAGLVDEIAAPFREYPQTPARILDVFSIIVATTLVALSFLVVGKTARGRRRAPRGWVPAAMAGAVVALEGCAFLFPGPRWVTLALGGHVLTVLSPVLFGSAALLLLVMVWRLEPAVRRRVIACAVPVLVTVPSISLGFGGFREYNMGHPDELHMLSPVQWLILLAIPVAAFAVAVGLNRRLEETRFGRGPRGEVGAHE